ncbi:hypothetical protein [Gemmatimonas sp.]|jgi:hypothetical protein|uniref:hypothetical protein n=1 Tax=Gemmatimonas sp. TaxID=1962908 RepID=UPI0025BBB253|nr:hypothetical protein [Gemmatimonas sp.]MCA2994912.1 hypothetical protein [Gemmatimonas sp.]
MTDYHDTPRPRKRAGEPAQVYLTEADQARLERLTEQLGASKSEVLRRGLEALELQHMSPVAHPALRLVGLVHDIEPCGEVDVARAHDQVLADDEARSWQSQSDGA